MMRTVFLLLIGMILYGCQNVERPEKPDNLIDKNKMIDIFYDAYLGNAAKSINNKKLRQMGIKLDSIIYVKYDIDSVQFAKSNEYYSLDLDNYTDIFSKVEAKLLLEQVELDSIKKAIRGINKEKNERAIRSKKPLSTDPTKLDSMVKSNMRTLIDPVQSEVETDSVE